jgi:hypothetical protein
VNSVHAVATFNVVVAFEPVELVVSAASEQVVEPACAEDLLFVVITDPFDTADVSEFKSA